jgi:hypothetical protein
MRVKFPLGVCHLTRTLEKEETVDKSVSNTAIGSTEKARATNAPYLVAP